MTNQKMETGKTYQFNTLTGKKLHTLKIIKREVNKSNGKVRVLASLDGGKEKYYYGINTGEQDIINVERWDSNVLGSDPTI